MLTFFFKDEVQKYDVKVSLESLDFLEMTLTLKPLEFNFLIWEVSLLS